MLGAFRFTRFIVDDSQGLILPHRQTREPHINVKFSAMSISWVFNRRDGSCPNGGRSQE
jgi:hypothetical protein